ncbi:MAG: glycosyltransferase family 1 protein [Bacteroidetes bacterium]|nr:glycosyltransferase family 1 protein [Bacteroidota bacterium]
MKLLKLSNVNHQYHEALQSELNTIDNSDYDSKLNAVHSKCIDFSNFYKLNLEALQLCEVTEALVNITDLRNAWYLQKQKEVKNTAKEFALDLIDFHKPDIVFDHSQILKGSVREIKNKFPFVRQISTWDCWASSPADGSLGYDLYFTCVKKIEDQYRAAGQNCILNKFGFERSILHKIQFGRKENKVCFIGSLSSNQHNYRNQILHGLRKKNALDWWIGNIGTGFFTKSKLRELLYFNFRGLADNFAFERHNRGLLFGLEMYQTMANYSMTLNTHGDFVDQIGNMRLSEAAGSGTCQLIDYKPNAKDYFEPDTEAIFFKSKEELLDKVSYLILNPAIAESIGKAGQQRVLKDHNFEQHVVRFWETVTKNL